MKIIGLTGGIGSGKTTVLKLFKQLGYDTYIADDEAKKLMNSDKELISDIKLLFGAEAYKENKLNRPHIAAIVFEDKEKLGKLNKIVHPKVKQHFINFVKASSAKFVIYESAILFESGTYKQCDYIITVIANLNERLERIAKRDGISKKQIMARMKNQLDDEFKIKKSHFVIDNSDIIDAKSQVLTIFNIFSNL
ncbi:dephospho-CoA kinase [Lutibacter citreus]|uniref:dephospho-CoA kinase n=1 Tax=Lutibacter citreus TaxID=2138210 RepID=UPI000DBE3EF1|nr:dephospho-CoA kinase [Lutibacter citreus]